MTDQEIKVWIDSLPEYRKLQLSKHVEQQRRQAAIIADDAAYDRGHRDGYTQGYDDGYYQAGGDDY